jgi:ATP-dependent DNA helicase RecG
VTAEVATDRLAEPLKKAIGARAANALEKALGLVTTGDLLRHYPRRYLELGELTEIGSLPENEMVSFVAEVASASIRQMNSRRGQLMNVVVTDGQDTIDLTFFNNVYVPKRDLTIGRRALFSGKVSRYKGKLQLAQPKYELFEGEIDREELAEKLEAPYAIYRASELVTTGMIRNSMRVVLDTLDELADPIPAKVRLRRGLIDLRSAFRQLHRPADKAQLRQALHRLTFEEAFVLQTILIRRRRIEMKLRATPRYSVPGGLLDALDARLPFTLTAGQVEVGEQIADDLAQTHPMRRLLQGEVGSGKTVVALRAMLTVVDGGGQAALLAPTEVLAAQHHRSITALLGELASAGMLGGDERGTRVALLTGSLSAPARRKALLDAASADAGIVVGTHALLQDKVQFADLGLIVVDEQHRFGVAQRDAMREKGITVPHLLVMTATPIPRTVAMTVFGDLETSTLVELPAGRPEIASHVVPATDLRWVERTWQRVAEEAAAGNQAYVVCPRIGDKDELDGPEPDDYADDATPSRRPARAVVEVLAQLREMPALSKLVIEPLHGRMPADARDDVMRRFAAGEVDVLVATTVIEVGVDVPNATVMVVMDADRFGVSQLHQLRGRVGRGARPGLCLMITEAAEGPATARLAAVAATRDGFALSRLDLEQRREGDVLGAAQSGGKSSLKLLKVLRDEKLIEDARADAAAVVAADPRLVLHPALEKALRVWLAEEREVYLDRG